MTRASARERDEYRRKWKLPPYNRRRVLPGDAGTPLYLATVASQGFDPATDCEDWSLRGRYGHLLREPSAIHALGCGRWVWEPCDCGALDPGGAAWTT